MEEAANTRTSTRRWGEWAAWVLWVVACFLLAFIAGGILYAVLHALMPATLQNGSLGDFVVSIFIYAALIALLLSISRIRGLNIRTRPRVLGRVILPVGIAGLAVLFFAVHMVSLLVFLVAIVAAGLLVVFANLPPTSRQISAKQLGIGRMVSWGDIGLGIAGYVIYFVIFILITMLLMKLVPSYNSAQPQDLGFTTLTGIERIVGFITLVVITPLAEELIMRGFLLGKLRSAHMPFWPAAVIVSLLFGLAHGQWNVGVDTFILSMVASYLRETTGTIWPGVIIHMTKNAIAYVALFILMMK